MQKANNYAGIDNFRMIAALLIVAIHTAPFSSLNTNLDTIFTLIIARIAVPFFLITTGYFVISQYDNPVKSKLFILKFLKKTAILYSIAIVIYLPINFYAGHFDNITPLTLLKMLIFDGTMYHLWYLPASILGSSLTYLFLKIFPYNAVISFSVILYLIGMLGDSYYGLIAEFYSLSQIYSFLFELSTYTRNGLFYVPIFLIIGISIRKQKKALSVKTSFIYFFISLTFMIVEGIILHDFEIPRHDSMYLFLLPCTYFLFNLLLAIGGKDRAELRPYSMFIYIIHPMMIIVIRAFAKFINQDNILIENSLIHYVAVCLASIFFAVTINKLQKHIN